jgi:imidazolonepropionase-like amidohydrolase
MKWGADVIKICASGGVLSESDPVDVPQLTPDELTAIISEAHKWKRKTAAHAHGDLAAKLAVEAGIDSIEHGSFLTEETLKLMKAKGVYLVPTRMAVYWTNKGADAYPPRIAAKARAAAGAHEKMFRTALKVGVPIAFGTDSGVSPLRHTRGRQARRYCCGLGECAAEHSFHRAPCVRDEGRRGGGAEGSRVSGTLRPTLELRRVDWTRRNST